MELAPLTGKSIRFTLEGRELTLYNQRCRDWTHPYPYNGEGNLANSGCGIFSLCHCAQWLTGRVQDPERWADFAVTHAGRGDDGTDRPLLLRTLMTEGEAAGLGFRYEGDGLRNDRDTLYDFLKEHRGVSMCNLRAGHIVSLVDARERDGRREVLAVDSYSESGDVRVRDRVTEVIPGSEIVFPVRNEQGLVTGTCLHYAAFWVEADLPKDFNLLWRV